MVELKSGFFNAVMVDDQPDRIYNAEDINEHLKGLVSDNGIYANISSACQVYVGEGMQVVVKPGRGKVNNHWFEIESDTTLAIDAADVILNRIDAIVVKWSAIDRTITLGVKKGEPATTPQPPTLTRNDEEYEICLAMVLVYANATSLKVTDVTDFRSVTSYCGWIVALRDHFDTTTLFNSYQTAQAEFLSQQKVQFTHWFESMQDEIAKAHSLYREYSAVYGTINKNEQEIAVPESINYIHNGLDILNVYINGRRLIEGTDYEVTSDGDLNESTINLTEPLEVVGTLVLFVNSKSIEDAVAENVVVQVESLEEQFSEFKSQLGQLGQTERTYIASGTNDNITLSNIVKSFLDGSGDYVNVNMYASMKLNIVGELGIGELIEDQMVFDFHSTNNVGRRIILDFGNATLPIYPAQEGIDILAGFGCNNDVTIENANIFLGDYTAKTIYVFHGGVIRKSYVNVWDNNSYSTNIYGAYATEEISDSTIFIYGGGNVYSVYDSVRTQNNTIDAQSASSGTAYAVNTSQKGFIIGNRIQSGKVLATSGLTQIIGNVIIGG